jgi:hypothetical protein
VAVSIPLLYAGELGAGIQKFTRLFKEARGNKGFFSPCHAGFVCPCVSFALARAYLPMQKRDAPDVPALARVCPSKYTIILTHETPPKSS